MPQRRVPAPRFVLALVLGVGALAMAVLGLLLVPAANARAAQTTVEMADFSYVPQKLTIRAGENIVWVNRGGINHNVTAVDGSWDSGRVGPGEMFIHQFDMPGVYRFYSRYYAGADDSDGMSGEVRVLPRDAAQGAPDLDALRAQLRAAVREVRSTNRPSAVARTDSLAQADTYIAGQIVAGTTGISNTTVTLRRYRPSDNSNDQVILSATTSVTGGFMFVNPPALAANLAYYVEFGPQTSNPNLAYLWDSYDVDTFAVGDQVTLAPLDVSNVPLVAPPDNATAAFPVLFQWQRRSLTSDTYALYLVPLSGVPVRTNFLGYISEILFPVQSSIRTGEPYDWGIYVADSQGDGGAGLSQARTVTFAQAQATATVTPTVQITPTATSTTAPATATVTNTPAPTNTSAPSPTPGAQTLLAGLTTDNRLVYFNSAAPGTILANVAITGLAGGENILGIDTRPATGQLYGLSSASRLYRIDRTSGAASIIGTAPLSPTLAGMAFGFDFNPVVDRIRIVGSSGQDLRAHPDTGAVVAVDGALAFAASDPNAGQTPNVVGAAYTNNFAGTNATTLYDIDAGLDILVSQTPPNSGTLNTIGALGVNATELTGFDIAPGTGAAFAALMLQGRTTSDLYTVGLSSGTAALVGTIGDGLAIRGLAVVPDAPSQATVTPTAGPSVTETPAPPTATSTTVAPTATATSAPATATATVAPATVTSTPAPATATSTSVAPTATGTSSAATPTATSAPATATVVPGPTATTIPCGDGNLCSGYVVVRAYIDFGCDGFFNRGTDYPLFGTTVTATLPNGTTRTGVVDENGNALITGINLTPTDTVQVRIDAPPLPTWVQQFGYGLAACGNSPMTRTVTRSNFGVLGVGFVDFRFGLSQP